MRYTVFAVLMICMLVCTSAFAASQTFEKEFFHQLKVGEPSQSWEHKIDLPDEYKFNGWAFDTRELDLREGKLVIEHEEFTPSYYYVKVRLAKPHASVPMAGKIKISLVATDNPTYLLAPKAPVELKLSEVGASLKPIFTWKTDCRYAAVALFDLTEQQTVWERISTTQGYKAYDEGYLKKGHRYIWAVKVSNKFGVYSAEARAAFRIDEVNGVVVAIPE